MSRNHPHIPFERYADDAHLSHLCKSAEEAQALWSALQDRFAACKLVLHREKTKIVYCKDANRRGDFPNQSFDFLGFTFRARKALGRGRRPFAFPAPAGRSSRSGRCILWSLLAPQHQNIDPLIGNAVRPQWPCDAPRRMLGVPWLHPWPDALLQTRHNLIGDAFDKDRFSLAFSFQTGLRCCNPTRPAPMSGGAAVKAGGGVEGDRPVCTTLLRRTQTRRRRPRTKSWRKTGDTPRAALKGLALTAPGPQPPTS